MAYYYSASERAFFSSEFMTVGEMPADKVAVADGTWKTLVADQSAGKIIRTGASNAPESAAQSLAALTGYAVPAGMTVAGGVSATGSISAGGALTAGGTLTVKGGASLASASVSGTMDVTGTTNLKSTLTVAGKTTAKAMSATDISASTITTTGNASVGGTLTATGAATLNNTLNVAGKSTLKAVSATDIDAATLDTTGNSSVGGTLTVKGSAVVGGKNVVLTVNGFTANASGAVTVPNYEQDGVKVVSNPDYNTLTAPGFYHCNSTGANNGPGYAAKMIVFSEKTAGHVTQIAFPIHNSTSSIFCPKMRSRNMEGEWEEWKTILLAESDEDVAAKTFTSDDGFVRMTMPTVEKGVAPSATQYSYVGIYDKTGFNGTSENRLAFFQHAARNDGSVETGIFSVDPKSTGGNVVHLSAGWTPEGVKIARTNAIPADDADGAYDIATVHWTRLFGGSWWGIGANAPSVSSRYPSNDANDIDKTGFYTNSSTANMPYNVCTMLHVQRAYTAGVSAYQCCFADNGRLFTRSKNGDGVWSDWVESASTQWARDTFLPLTGGTLTGYLHGTSFEMSAQSVVKNTFVVTGGMTVPKGTLPEKTQYAQIVLSDNTGFSSSTVRAGAVDTEVKTDGTVTSRLRAYKWTKDSSENVAIQVGYNANGNTFTYAPHPKDGSNDNNIATTKWVRDLVRAAVPTGTILPFDGTNVPSGYLVCNGAAVSRTTYAALFAVLGTRHGEGDGKTTFNLPNAHRRFLEMTTTTSEVGETVEAGLPNISGSFVAVFTGNEVSGAFSSGGTGRSKNGSDWDGQKINFSASSSSGIYGNSSSVQPTSIRCLAIIKT